MRKVLMAAMIIAATVQTVQAADMPDMPFLRGSFSDAPLRSASWQGVYIGGQASYGAADMDFTNSNKDLLAKLLNNVDVESEFKVSDWPLMGKASNRNSGFGGFVGYNLQWEDVVVGLELNYIHGKFDGSSGGSQGRTFFFPTDYYTTLTATSTGSVAVKDYGSVRVRGAYAINNFLPYMFAGVALGQADFNREAGYDLFYKYVGTQTPPLPNIGPNKMPLSDNASGHFIYGYSAGLGVDIMLLANVFFRAEFEYLRFAAPVDTAISTVRAGIGYKF